MAHAATDYIEYLVTNLVDDAESASVDESLNDGDLDILINVPESERGRIIGRQGRLIRSLRVLARASAGRDSMRASLEIEDAS